MRRRSGEKWMNCGARAQEHGGADGEWDTDPGWTVNEIPSTPRVSYIRWIGSGRLRLTQSMPLPRAPAATGWLAALTTSDQMQTSSSTTKSRRQPPVILAPLHPHVSLRAPRVLDDPVLAGSAPYPTAVTAWSRLAPAGAREHPALAELDGAAGAVDERGDGLTRRGALQRGLAVAPPPGRRGSWPRCCRSCALLHSPCQLPT